MKTPTLAPVSFRISPTTAAGGIHVRPLRKPVGMTPRQWKRAWRHPWIGPDRRTDLAVQIQDANPGLYCGGAAGRPYHEQKVRDEKRNLRKVAPPEGSRLWRLRKQLDKARADRDIAIAQQEERLRQEYADHLAEMEADARDALEERTRAACEADAEMEEYRREGWETYQRMCDAMEDAADTFDPTQWGGEPEPDNGLPDSEVPPFFGTSLADEIRGMEYAAQCARSR